MSITQAIILTSSNRTSSGGGGGSTQNGTGDPGTGTWNGITYTLTPSTNGIGNPGTAYPGDTITWTITSSPVDTSGRTMYIWVDAFAIPGSNFVENTDNGTFVLDGSGTGTFTLTVSSNPTHNLFIMYVGMSLYQGFVTHGVIGI